MRPPQRLKRAYRAMKRLCRYCSNSVRECSSLTLTTWHDRSRRISPPCSKRSLNSNLLHPWLHLRDRRVEQAVLRRNPHPAHLRDRSNLPHLKCSNLLNGDSHAPENVLRRYHVPFGL